MKNIKNNQIFQYFNILIIIAVFAIASFAKSEEMNVAPEGFTALFNGKDLTGWGKYQEWQKDEWKEHWKVDDNILRTFKSLKKGEIASIGTLKKDYKNFILLIDVRFPKKQSDSGIFTRLGQINLRVDSQGPIGFEISRKKYPELHKKGNIEIAKAKFGATEINKWYKIKIVMKGNFVTIYVNEKLHVKDVELIPHLGHTESNIGLQKHKNKGKNHEFPMNVDFRNIFIKEID